MFPSNFFFSKSRGIFGLFKSYIGIFFCRSIASPFRFVRQQTGLTKRYKPHRRTQIFLKHKIERHCLYFFGDNKLLLGSRAQNPLAHNRRWTFCNICIIPTKCHFEEVIFNAFF